VILAVAVDPNDEKKQLNRVVCVRLSGTQVCRQWDTGKLMLDEQSLD
jgi:hypothetical protein